MLAGPQAVGQLVAGRFEVLGVAGSGGMGTVYKALDQHTGQPVALKLLHNIDGSEAGFERFVREARVLSQLQHRSIVEYVAHGQTADRRHFLAMQWLEGEDLASRMRRGRLPFHQTLTIAHAVAEGLEYAHRRHIIHRDVKPANIFLDKQTGAVKLLDFGIARWALSQALTHTGAVIGTVEYMAPEQAQGSTQISAKADMYSLGCVLYECLAGTPPHVGDHPAAVLARVLFDEPVPLAQRQPELPLELLGLVDSMLARDPERRPGEVSRLLQSFDSYPSVVPASPLPGRSATSHTNLTHSEERLVCAVLAAPRHSAPQLDFEQMAAAGTVGADELLRPLPAAASQVRGARVTWLAQGWLLVVFERVGVADELLQAARLAHELQREWTDSQVALVVARRGSREALAVGSLVDSCSQLLQVAVDPANQAAERLPGVFLDDISASLLDVRFRVDKTPAGWRLGSERATQDMQRLFLGQPMPCIGRETELGMLDLHARSCFEEETARAVLVIAPAGIGKSHLQREFRARLQQRAQPFTLIVSRGDPLTDSSPYAPLREALRALCEVQAGMDEALQQTKLRQRVLRHKGELLGDGIVEFLCELLGVPISVDISPQVAAQQRAARHDPKLMNAQIARAAIAFLRAECRAQPVVLVLEDLHWFDTLSIKLVDDLLHGLGDAPLFVLALARPEISERHPKLWANRPVDVLSLRALSKKPCERLVQQILGGSVKAERIDRIIEQSQGNPLFLEELMRSVLSGGSDTLPPSILVLLEQRVTVLSADERLVLRAASILGATFWQTAVGSLCALSAEKLPWILESLIRQDLIERRRQSRFAGETEYVFRHGLMREAVYQTVTAADRQIGHRLAARYLKEAGERDAYVLACHFESGGESDQAAAAFVAAAEQSLLRYDLSMARKRSEHALELGVEGVLRGTARTVQALSSHWEGDWDTALSAATEALPLCTPGSIHAFRTLGVLMMVAVMKGRTELIPGLVQHFLAAEPKSEAIDAYVEAGSFMVLMFVMTGNSALVHMFVNQMRAAVAFAPPQSIAQPLLGFCTGTYLVYMSDKPWQAAAVLRAAYQQFDSAGDSRQVILTGCLLGLALRDIGEREAAEQTLRDCLARALKMTGTLVPIVQLHLALVLEHYAEPEARRECETLARAVTADFSVNAVYTGIARSILARCLLWQGQAEQALELAHKACSALGGTPIMQAVALPSLIESACAVGPREEALRIAEQGVALLAKHPELGYLEPLIRTSLAATYQAAAQHELAQQQRTAAGQCIRRRSAGAPDAAALQRFLDAAPQGALLGESPT